MAQVLKSVVLTRYELVCHLKSSGVLVREYGIYPPYAIEYVEETGDIRIDGLHQPKEGQ